MPRSSPDDCAAIDCPGKANNWRRGKECLARSQHHVSSQMDGLAETVRRSPCEIFCKRLWSTPDLVVDTEESFPEGSCTVPSYQSAKGTYQYINYGEHSLRSIIPMSWGIYWEN